MAAALPPEYRDEILGDLEERFHGIVRERGAAAARLWYLRQAGAFAVTGVREGLRSLLRPDDRRRLGAAWTRDVRFALRSVAAHPGFAVVTVLTLALGIGGTTAVFSVVDGVLLRPLPFPEPDRLVAVQDEFEDDHWWSAAPATVRAWRARSATLAGVGWFQEGSRSLRRAGELREIPVRRVSAGLLEVLDVELALGRGFREGESRSGAEPVAILTHELWSALGGRPSAIGAPVSLDEIPHTVIGVLPPDATGDALGDYELLVPRIFTETELRSPGRVVRTVARLAPGATIEEAEAELEAILADTGGAEGWGVRLTPLRERLVGTVRPVLLVLLGAVGFVLLVACVNVSNLLLARGASRRRELAVRSALGAGRGRLVRQLLTEATVLSLLGGAVGILVAAWGADALVGLAPGAIPRIAGVTVDGRVLLFTLAVSVGAGLVFGLAPAVRSSDFSADRVLHGERGAGAGGATGRIRSALVASQVALVLVLLVGAGLMLRSFDRLRRVDPGFPVEDRAVLEITLSEASHPTPGRVGEFFRELDRRFRAVPGVVASGVVTHPPLFGDDWSAYHLVESVPQPSPGGEPIGGMEAAGPGYFEALGVPLLEGRTFTAGDAGDESRVAVVDAAMARRYWPDRSPLGDRVRLSREGPLSEWREVVGVVGAVRYELDAAPRPRVYLPDGAIPVDDPTRYVVVHAEPDRLDAVVPLLRRELREMAPNRPVASIRTMEEAARGSVSGARLQAFLLGAFGLLGLVLGAVGVYGVVSYTVSRRTRDLGVRLTLGAGRADVLVRVLLETMKPVLVGVALGLAAALALGRALSGMLFDVGPASPGVLAAVSGLLVVVAASAALIPGLRATRVDPARTLRAD